MLKVKIEPGIFKGFFRQKHRILGKQTALRQPFPSDTVWGLGINVDKPFPFLHMDQGIFGFPFGVILPL